MNALAAAPASTPVRLVLAGHEPATAPHPQHSEEPRHVAAVMNDVLARYGLQVQEPIVPRRRPR